MPILNKKLFDVDVEQKPTRNGYGEGLVEAGRKDKNVVVLCCDLTESTRSLAFAKEFPERFFQIGVAEQNMAGMAAGMAQEGLVPFTSSYAVFSPGRNWDQTRVSIAYNNANVKIAGAHAGISVGPDGATHQALEDIAIMRVLPNMIVIYPCDVHEARKATIAAATHKGPVYLRLAREKTPVITTLDTPFEIGKAQVVRKGRDVTIIASGPLLYEALLAAEICGGNKKALAVLMARYPLITKNISHQYSMYGIHHNASRLKNIWSSAKILSMIKKIGTRDVEVINCPTIKPLDSKTILASVKKTGRAITVEEHQIHGGLFGAITELTAPHFPVPISPIGMPDMFGESGETLELQEKYGMTASFIIQALSF